jgi:hypothetical protein
MTDSRASVQRALDRLNACRPFERASRLHELLVAGGTLRDETEALNDWLIRAWDRLDAEPDRKDFVKCEERLLAEIQRYTEMHTLLGKALVAIGKEAA